MEEVEFLLGRLVESALLDGFQRVGVQCDGVDAAQRVEEHGVVRFGAEGEAPGPLGQAAVGGPPVQQAFHQEVVAGLPCGGEAGLGRGAQGRDVAPARGKVQFQFHLPGGGAQECGARFLLAFGHVEPVEVEGLGVVGAAPPGAAGHDPAVAQGHPLPVGAMPGQPVALTGAQRIGQGVEEIGVARVERADDHIGHGIPPGCMVRRALPVRSVEARRDEEQGALERCELHGSALLPPVSGRDADTLRDHRRTVHRFSDAAQVALRSRSSDRQGAQVAASARGFGMTDGLAGVLPVRSIRDADPSESALRTTDPHPYPHTRRPPT
ncbi:hypothetical protein SVIOM74S_01954 [Streptomyces violarus]